MNASAIVTEPDTGRILAMVSRPNYDTNLLAVHSTTEASENMEALRDDGISPYDNRPTTARTEPGSTFKLIDAVAMLESGEYSPDTSLSIPNELDLPQTNTPTTNLRGRNCNPRYPAHFAWTFCPSR